jgi:hypothetical protein
MSIERWREVDGDNTLAIDWPLTEDSHVWEIGGFEGRWAQQIWDKYHCHIDIFEPQWWAVEKMARRFEGIQKISIHPYGLWNADCVLQIGNYHTDGAGIVKPNDGREITMPGTFKHIYAEMTSFPHGIDLCLMNVEGAEFTLIPIMAHSGIIGKIKNFFCQFHPDGNIDLRNIEIAGMMNETHDQIWSYYPTAVAWKRRGR